MPVQWEGRYETNETKIDQQHQQLFRMINDLEKKVQTGDFTNQSINEALKYLINYTRIHFTYEELCMFRYKCPVAQKNMDAHDAFTKALEGYKQTFDQEGASQKLLTEIYDTASQWLIGHICQIDTQLRPFLNQ
ncbi:MAG: hemerythrin family protein [Blastocatellia bacterium]|nr:hemerythrin family protein [Blastocatellia bacterium]